LQIGYVQQAVSLAKAPVQKQRIEGAIAKLT